MKQALIISIALILLIGCAATPAKNDESQPELILLAKGIYTQDWDANKRSYHFKKYDLVIYTELFSAIKDTIGVQDIYIYPYQITVLKSPLFDWDLINKTVIMYINN